MHRGARRSSVRVGKLGRFPRRDAITAEQFRDARVFGGLTREQAAAVLDVSLRTIGNWETGKARPPYSAFKLLRVLRHGDFVDARWSGYRIVRGKLVTPENHTFHPSDMAWLSLLVRRANAFSEMSASRDATGSVPAGARRQEATSGSVPVAFVDDADRVLHATRTVLQSTASGAMPPKAGRDGLSMWNQNPPINRVGLVTHQIPPTPVAGCSVSFIFGAGAHQISPCSNTGRILLSDIKPSTAGGGL